MTSPLILHSSTVLVRLMNCKTEKPFWEKWIKNKGKVRNQHGKHCCYSGIWNQCSYPALALPAISDSSLGDKSKQVLPGEMSHGSCPWCWICSAFSPTLSLPLALCHSVSLSVSICPGPVCKHTLPVSLKTVKARLLQPPLAHSDYNVSDRWNIGNHCVHSVSGCSQYVLFTVSI